LNGLIDRIDLSDYPLASLSGSPSSKQASIQLNHCEFKNGDPTQWSAILNVPDMGKQQITKSSLQRESKQIAIGNAINAALNNRYRVARQPDENGTF
jgi:hypothetical protein